MCSGSCGKGCIGCKVMTGVVALLITLTTIVAAMGVWVAHNTPSGWLFGAPGGSLAIVAFVFSIMAWLKLVKKLCPCNSQMCGAGCPCGKMNCDCAKGGMGGKCPMCHNNPCTCTK